MTDLTATIAPKSNQLSADDLIAGPRTITVTKVELTNAEQPVAISFQGDENRPFLPCKSMRRVLVHVWGADGNAYVGRSMTLYRDDKVVFGGLAVGGIRISHVSHINQDVTMALTATRGNKKPFVVKPLRAPPQDAPKRQTITQWLDDLGAELKAADMSERHEILARDDVKKAHQTLRNGALDRLKAITAAALDELDDDGELPADTSHEQDAA